MRSPRGRGARRTALLLLALTVLPGCRMLVYALAAPFVFEPVELAPERIERDLAYRSGPGADPEKHRLDLFRPADTPTPWPAVVFVHGGGWTGGDKDLEVGGADVYANIGRFFASRGVGAAVISYRLQPGVAWTDQVDDVARAVAYVRERVAAQGGDPGAVFLMGHSAGAQLVAHVALDPRSAAGLCGWIPVSGAGFDLADPETYALGASPRYYEERFRNGEPGDAWMRDASPTRRAHRGAPPALVLVAEDDWPSLHRQAELLDRALDAAGVPSRRLEIPDEDHYSVVLALTREDGVAARAILAFIRDRDC